MDKLKAEKILGVAPGASRREIKRAYAAMLRMYHPEDYPQEFQQIQEAYELLTRELGQGPSAFRQEEERQNFQERETREMEVGEREAGEQKTREMETGDGEAGEREPVREEKAPEEESEAGERENSGSRSQEGYQEKYQENRSAYQSWDSWDDWDENQRRFREQEQKARQEEELRKAREKIEFEKMEWKAREEEKLRNQKTIAMALKDLEVILNSNSKKHRLKSYEDFFAREEYKEVLFMPECVEGVCDLLEGTRLKREVYDMFAREFHMREYKPEQLKPGARRLYYILDQHCKFQKKRRRYEIGAGIFTAVLIFLRRQSRVAEENDWFYFGLILVIAGFYYGYRRLLKYFSRWRIHICYSLLIVVSQFIMLMTEAYTPLLGSQDAGDTFGALVFMGGCVYFMVTAAAFVIASIRHKAKNGKSGPKQKNK